MPINAAWHRANRMPRNPSLDQRVAWHLEHARNCGCRAISGAMRDEILRRGLKIPALRRNAAPAGRKTLRTSAG
jgi:hypothetical protein